MKIHYVIPHYGAASEVFSLVEINALSLCGVTVSVSSMSSRFKSKIANARTAPFKVYFPEFSGIGCIFHAAKFIKLYAFCFQQAKSTRELVRLLISVPVSVQIARHIATHEPDVVHLFWGHYPCLVFKAMDLFSCKAVKSMFCGAYDLVSDFGVMRWGMQSADVIFTHAEANLQTLSAYTSREVMVLYRGVDCSSSGCSELEQKGSGFRCVLAGRLIPDKGFDIALEYMARFAEENNVCIDVDVCGDGPELGRLKQLATRYSSLNVIFHGMISQVSLFKLFDKGSVILLPSRYSSERIPNVLKEAMLRRCIAITSATPGINELIEHKADGFVISFENYCEFEEVMSLVFYDKAEMNKMSELARNKVLAKFDIAKISARRVEVYSNILDGGN